jgi:hypothetical protein
MSRSHSCAAWLVLPGRTVLLSQSIAGDQPRRRAVPREALPEEPLVNRQILGGPKGPSRLSRMRAGFRMPRKGERR